MAPMLLVTPQITTGILAKNHPVMVTALLYLRDALRAEDYESCGQFTAIAREFGALDSDLRPILEHPFRKAI